jgi:hypothetical protein
MLTAGAHVTMVVNKSTAVYLPFVTASASSPFKHNPSIKVHTQLTEPLGVHNFDLFVHSPAKCRYISKNLIEEGVWEGQISDRILDIMGSAADVGIRTFVDVGANVGWFSLAVSRTAVMSQLHTIDFALC